MFGLALLALGVAAAAAFLLPAAFGRARGPQSPKAAIVDQLSLTRPNTAFGATATAILEGAGYEVDYYPGEEVTVDFYRNLPGRGYDLLVLRNHSARRPNILASRLPDEAALFTAEPYDRERYVDDQDTLRLVKVSYDVGEEVFFGVRSDFVTSSMRGDFDGAVIILMGCNGLTTDRVAAAFVGKGAKAVIGWSDLVSDTHTDEATESLLRHLVGDGETIGGAVEAASDDVGPDSTYGSSLKLYPPQAAALSLR